MMRVSLLQDIAKVATYWLLDRLYKTEEEKKIETFAIRHSLENITPAEHAPAATAAAATTAAAAVAAGTGVAGALTRGVSTRGRVASSEFMPSGVDLNAIAKAAAEETVSRNC